MKLLSYRLIKSFRIELICIKLFILNLLKKQRLLVENVQIYERILIFGNNATLVWDVKGCHKIKVKNFGTFPGSSKGLSFFVESNEPLEIYFYGISSKRKKVIEFVASKIDLKFFNTTLNENFNTKSFLESKIETKFEKDNLESVFGNINPQTNFDNISLNFDAFNEINLTDKK